MQFSAFCRILRERGLTVLWPVMHASLQHKRKKSEGLAAYQCRNGISNKTILLAMKLTAFILLIACLQVSARGNAQRISLSKKNIPLKEVFAAIKKQSGYTVFCNYKILEKAKNVDIRLENATVEEILKAALKEQGLDYVIEDRMIVIVERKVEDGTSFLPEAFTQSPPPKITVTGKVTDVNGAALEGAYILVKSTRTGTTTNSKGEFTIDIPDKVQKILVVTYIGKASREINLGDKTEISVTLESSVQSQEEVVVVG